MEILPNLEEITRRCHTILAASVGHPTEPLRKDQPAGSPGMTQKTVYVSMDDGAADKDGELIGKGPESLTVRLDVLVCQP